ncbi:MAG TPA: tRNA (adenosine(37)-N6)-dimethylallyltransferase MiaA [Rhodospirillaceae bacterium]|nr:tRNA (adenosine(37)-N6)-dimethylallyltransferase MiaA [Rhodospirillaceae bacterium]
MALKRPAVVIGGPTASGKSALALAVAREFDGVILNADSMQVYKTLPILTNQPEAQDQALVPHRLYGLLEPTDVCSAGRWQSLAVEACEAVWQAGQLPVVVGGTGLYIKALTEGLSPIPEIAEAVRRATRALFSQLGNQAFHAALAERDPVMAARLDPGNSQRLMRAWEVLDATGRSLAEWQAQPAQPPVKADFLSITLVPPAGQLYPACDARFLTMLRQGALDEVRFLQSLALPAGLPILKALGVSELGRHLAGEIDLARATSLAQQATRNYAKRQGTWFRHQMPSAQVQPTQFSERFLPEIFSIIRQFLLTGAG